jgi:hypothetical protein
MICVRDECRGFAGSFVGLTKLQDRWELQTLAFERYCLHIYHRDNVIDFCCIYLNTNIPIAFLVWGK